MASAYGPWVAGDDWRSWVEITKVSETDTTFNFKVRAWFQADAGSSTGSGNVQGWKGYKIGSGSDVWSSATNIDPFSAGSSKYFLESTYTSVQVTKTHSAQTVKGYADVEGKAGLYSGYKSKATASITVPAKTNYLVTYNDNGGSGAPASQTKWYGETLTLSSTNPTRTNYNFAGWNTKADGTGTNYASGGSYTGNAAITLYAKWTLAATSPRITKLVAYRSDSSGNRVTTASEDYTSHITVEYGWSLDSGITINANRTIQITLGSSAQTAIQLAANSGSSGKVTYASSLPVASSLTVSATLRDLMHGLSATSSVKVGTLFKPFSMANSGKAAAFFGFAGTAWDRILKIFGRLDIEGRDATYVQGAQGNAGIRFYKDTLNINQWNPAILIQTKSGGTWQIGNYDGEELRVIYLSKSKIDAGTNSPDVNIGFGNTVRNWHKAISSWVQIASTTGTTAKTFSDLATAGYSEVLVTVKYSTTFASSVVIPIAQLNSTATTWYFGGWYWSEAYFAYADMTLTKITPYKVKIDSVDQNGTWTVYAR